MKILQYQQWHALTLAALLLLLYGYASIDPTFLQGSLWGVPTSSWLLGAIAIPIIHQIYVLICWRSELYYKSISRTLGKSGFTWYRIGFAILISLRPVSLVALSISNAGTLPIPAPLPAVLSGALLIPTIYVFYSIVRYFGFNRAFGIDHFYPEKYKNTSLVNKGIFRYIPNAMYTFGLLVLWIPGIMLQSKAGIALALFNHIYVWAHYYFTEKPDMKKIYNSH